MRKKLIVFAVLALFISTLLTGCLTSRIPVELQAHPSKDAITIRTVDKYNQLLMMKTTHQFWTCVESDSKVVCEMTCDGDSDLECISYSY